MADLRVGVNVETGELGKLAAASQQVASSTTAVGASFNTASQASANLASKLMAQGLTAQQAQSALVNLGMTAKNAAAILAGLTGQTVALTGAKNALANATAKSGSGIDAWTRQLANSAVRIAASELGMGQLGFAFGRLGAMSTALAPILASTFTVFAVVAFVEMVYKAIEAYERWLHLGEETTHKIDDQVMALVHEGDQLDVVNARLQNQINKLEHKPENYLALYLAENKVRADQLSKSLEDVMQKEIAILKAGAGTGSEIFLDKGNVAAVGKELEPLERKLQLAILTNDKAAEMNVLIEKQFILTKALEEEKAKHTEKGVGPRGTTVTVGRGPDQDAVNTYTSLLKGVQQEIDNIAKVGKAGELELLLAQLKTAADREKAALKYEQLLGKIYEDGVRWMEQGATKELEALDKRTRMEDEAERKLEAQQKRNSEEAKKEAREQEDAWQRAAEARISTEEEAYRVSQHASEERIRDIKAQEALNTAGLDRGPATTVFQSKSLDQQGVVAAAAMQDAKAAAADYQQQLDIVQSTMSEVNTETEEGAKWFKDLEKQMDQLRHQMDSAAAAADRWKTILKQIAGAQAQNSREMGFSMQNIAIAMTNAANAGFHAFNSSFIQMLHGAKSFTQVLQGLWTGMVESFVNAILRMAEYYVMRYVIMIAITKLFGATVAEESTGDITAKEVGRQAAIGDAAATAAIGAAWLGPAAAIAAAATTEVGLQAITSFAQGGVVKANLHEGEMVLPKHLSTFVQSAAAGASGMGGGRGGDSSSRTVHNHVNVTLNNHGGAMSQGDVTSAVKRALRQSGYSW